MMVVHMSQCQLMLCQRVVARRGMLAAAQRPSLLGPCLNERACTDSSCIAVQIYIVMMEPSDMYATYSCRLPSPVLL